MLGIKMHKGKIEKILDRSFNNKNFFQALPAIAAPSVIFGLIAVVILVLLPVEFVQRKVASNAAVIGFPIFAVTALLVLRYLYGNSLFFRLSFYMLLLITLTAYESFLLT
ncbi:MAG: hypothetical protein ACFFD4_02940, partial [Candidatus Odinarchaeota archaeon]